MIFTHIMVQYHPDATHDLLPRLLAEPIASLARSMPVLVVTGARQTGKTTLVRLGEIGSNAAYITLDDPVVAAQATQSPDELVARAPRLVIDEVQRSPEVLGAIKRAVDRHREAGRFLLTGSANLLLMHRISESLAGRAAYLTLCPLTRRELLGLGTAGDWDVFFQVDRDDWYDTVRNLAGPPQEWTELAMRGGYPTPAYHLDDDDARAAWFAGYVTTYLERDVQALAAIEHLADFRRLMRACALRMGGLLNQADLARDVGLAPSTAQRYVGLLETSYQLLKLPAFALNRTKRLTKAPKLYWSDTGLALHVADAPPCGAHLENLVLNDLLAWRSAQLRPPEILYWRTTKGAEVDFVIEWQGAVVPVEIKSSATVGPRDVRHLRTFLAEYRDLARGALVLYTGDEVFWAAPGVLAAPWWLIL